MSSHLPTLPVASKRSGPRDFHLHIAGKPYQTAKYEWLAHADEYFRDPAGTTRLVREINKTGELPPEHAHKFFGRLAIANAADVQHAIDAAYEVSVAYGRSTFEQRKRLILDIGETLEAHREELIYLGQCEGRPRMAYEWEINHHYEDKGTFREEILDFYIQQLKGEEINAFDRVAYYPYGVVGFIPPGNAAIYNSLSGMMGALIAGNALLVKPPRNRATQTMRFVELCEEVAARHGFPGLLSTVVGDSREIVEMWGNSPKIDVVVFYGGSGLGMEVGAMLTKKNTKSVLELAGSDAAVIWEDADITNAANAIYITRFLVFSGQVCISPKRLFVHHAIYDQFVERLKQLLSVQWVVGLPGELDTNSPYLLPTLDMDRKLCLATLEDAKRRGKPVISGGRWLDYTGAESPDGIFLEPTLIGDATPDMHCMSHEIFGPVLPIMKVHDLEETIRLANDTIYGLRASIWTNTTEVADRFIEASRTGSVFVNDHPLYFNGRAPYIGGIKASGFTGAKYFHLELSIRRYVHVGRSLPFYHFNEGMDRLKEGRHSEAAKEFDKALMLDRKFAWGHYGKALLHEATGLDAEAARELELALRLNPNNGEWHYRLGTLRYRAGQLPGAVEAMLRACELAPNMARAHANLGWYLLHSGDAAGASLAFETALSKTNDSELQGKLREALASCVDSSRA